MPMNVIWYSVTQDVEDSPIMYNLVPAGTSSNSHRYLGLVSEAKMCSMVSGAKRYKLVNTRGYLNSTINGNIIIYYMGCNLSLFLF